MKKIFFFIAMLAFCMESAAQDSAIFENEWVLTNYIVDGVNYYPPSNMEVQKITLDCLQHEIITNVCNQGRAQTVFDTNTNHFIVTSFGQTLMLCNLDEDNNYESMYFDFFRVYNPNNYNQYNYVITSEGNSKSLTITSGSKKAIYNSQSLATNRNERAVFNIYPNPVGDYLNITVEDIHLATTEIEIYDNLGRLCLKENLSNNTSSIDIRSLKKGVYLARIKSESSAYTDKFIKL